tara:strand:+ start:897 stop:1790 length:894 start_codon:yes stop_codon:yes gene_type:complete
LDVRQLRHFVALIEAGTEHAAAEEQHISQPGLSSSIKRLENELKVTLFDREGRGMRPNERGKIFHGYAKRILSQLRLAIAELEESKAKVVIAVSDMMPSNFIAILSERIWQRYPNIELQFMESHYDEMYPAVEVGSVDAAFLGVPSANPLPDSLVAKDLIRSQFGVYCSKDHPLAASQKPLNVEQLKQYPWLNNKSAAAITPVLPFFIDRTSLRKEDVNMISTDSLHMMKDLLFNSDSLCHVPELAVALEHEQGGLVKLDLPLRLISCKVVGIRHKHIASRVIDHIFDFIEEYFDSP